MRVLPSFLRADALAQDLDAELQSSKSQFLIPPKAPTLREDAEKATESRLVTLRNRRSDREQEIAKLSREVRDLDVMIEAFESARKILAKDPGIEAETDAKNRKVPRQTPARLPKAVSA